MHDSVFDRTGSIIAAIALGTVGVAMFMVEPLFLGALAEHRGFSNSQIGRLAAVELAGTGLAAIVAVFWIARLNWRIVAAIALLCAALGNFLSAHVLGIGALMTLRFLTAFFGLGVLYSLGVSIISRTSKPDRNFALAIVCQVGYGSLALFFMPVLVQRWGLSGITLPMAGLALLGFAFLLMLPAGDERRGTAASGAGEGARLQRWPVFLALGIHVIWYLGIGGIWAFVELIGSSAGLESVATGRALAISMVAGVSGAVLASILGQRIGRMMPYCIAMAVQLGAMLLFLDSSVWFTYLLAAIGFNIAWNFALPYMLGLIATADFDGRFAALIPAAQTLGVGGGPIIAGLLADSIGLNAVVWLACISAVSSLLFYVPLALYLARRVDSAP